MVDLVLKTKTSTLERAKMNVRMRVLEGEITSHLKKAITITDKNIGIQTPAQTITQIFLGKVGLFIVSMLPTLMATI